MAKNLFFIKKEEQKGEHFFRYLKVKKINR